MRGTMKAILGALVCVGAPGAIARGYPAEPIHLNEPRRSRRPVFALGERRSTLG